MEERPSYRVGLGHDTHRFNPPAPGVVSLRLGGVDIPYDRALRGHSDADVLLHAVTDALLGAAALGDIGDHFPDTDENNRGRDSAEMLALAAGLLRSRGWSIVNLDTIIFAEAPKLGAFKRVIAEKIASVLDLPADRVSVKAKTGEKIGIIGRGEAISAEAIVLIEAIAITTGIHFGHE
ncbi:MAG: 2-C-methyl-D-erythritol 2,4-cyclodiphosphate synthase [Thermoguttaceae bacterium]|nr:2-C-methyl-D-erythritol 2,4-cyclodiphosphate synthase [Thermoguttaceae bacterium]